MAKHSDKSRTRAAKVQAVARKEQRAHAQRTRANADRAMRAIIDGGK